MTQVQRTYWIDEELDHRFKVKLAENRENGSEVIRRLISYYVNEEEAKMLRQKLHGNHVIVDADWLEKNDPEQLDWIVDSEYCDFEREETVLEIQFRLNDMHEILYYACASDAPDADRPSRNQPPWAEDEWSDWKRSPGLTHKYAELI